MGIRKACALHCCHEGPMRMINSIGIRSGAHVYEKYECSQCLFTVDTIHRLAGQRAKRHAQCCFPSPARARTAGGRRFRNELYMDGCVCKSCRGFAASWWNRAILLIMAGPASCLQVCWHAASLQGQSAAHRAGAVAEDWPWANPDVLLTQKPCAQSRFWPPSMTRLWPMR